MPRNLNIISINTIRKGTTKLKKRKRASIKTLILGRLLIKRGLLLVYSINISSSINI